MPTWKGTGHLYTTDTEESIFLGANLHTCDRLPYEGDDVMLVGQGQAPAAPEEAHGGAHPTRPLLVAREPEHLAGPHMVHWNQICMDKFFFVQPLTA